jgi:hypothetical protein
MDSEDISTGHSFVVVSAPEAAPVARIRSPVGDGRAHARSVMRSRVDISTHVPRRRRETG